MEINIQNTLIGVSIIFILIYTGFGLYNDYLWYVSDEYYFKHVGFDSSGYVDKMSIVVSFASILLSMAYGIWYMYK